MAKQDRYGVRKVLKPVVVKARAAASRPHKKVYTFIFFLFFSVIANKASLKQALNHVVGIRKETLN